MVVVVVGFTKESVEVTKLVVVVLAKLVVVGLGMIVIGDVLDEGMVVVVLNGGAPVVDVDRIVVGQSSHGPSSPSSDTLIDTVNVTMMANRTPI